MELYLTLTEVCLGYTPINPDLLGIFSFLLTSDNNVLIGIHVIAWTHGRPYKDR